MSIEVLKSGRFRATIMVGGKRHREVWDTRKQAEAWEQRTRRDLALGIHADAPAPDPETGKQAAPLFADYAADWLAKRRNTRTGRALKSSTRAEYAALLAEHIEPQFGQKRLDAITAKMVRAWHDSLLPEHPTRRSHAYGLLRSIMAGAVDDEHVQANPCRIRGASRADRTGTTELPTVEQVGRLVAAMPGPKYQTMTLMAAWCGLRFGELTELRRKDVVVGADGLPVVIKVRRAVYRGVVDTPKSAAGVRDITIPPHIRGPVAEWLAKRPRAAESLLFPATRTGGHIRPSSLYKAFYAARDKAGCPTLRWHDLRHFAGTTVAQTGATLKEIQDHLGHSTVNAAMKYQHTAQGRGAAIAEAMSALAAPQPVTTMVVTEPEPAAVPPAGNVVPLRQPEQYMSLTAAARSIQLTVPQLRKIINRGELRTIRHAGREMVREADLDEFLARTRAEWG